MWFPLGSMLVRGTGCAHVPTHGSILLLSTLHEWSPIPCLQRIVDRYGLRLLDILRVCTTQSITPHAPVGYSRPTWGNHPDGVHCPLGERSLPTRRCPARTLSGAAGAAVQSLRLGHRPSGPDPWGTTAGSTALNLALALRPPCGGVTSGAPQRR